MIGESDAEQCANVFQTRFSLTQNASSLRGSENLFQFDGCQIYLPVLSI